MDFNITTPALLFSAITLLMLAYTNRFLALASLIRNLHGRYKQEPSESFLGQIHNLRRRIYYIRNMQLIAVISLFFCVLSMFLIFARQILIAKAVFGSSMVLMMISLLLSISEIRISIKALDLQLKDIEYQR